MPKINMIHHVNVQISDRQRTREWYERVLGAEFLYQEPLNDRQMQLRISTGEMHFTGTQNPSPVPSSHFAVDVDNWVDMIAHLDALGIPHFRTSASIGGEDPTQGRREDNGEHYTYIHDPDGNMIEWYSIRWGWKTPTEERSSCPMTRLASAGPRSTASSGLPRTTPDLGLLRESSAMEPWMFPQPTLPRCWPRGARN